MAFGVEASVYTAVFAPIAASLAVLAVGRFSRRAVELIAVTAAGLALLGSICLWHSGFTGVVGGRLPLPWLPGGPVRLSFYLDSLSKTFSLIVGVVGFLVVLYSLSYMERDPGYIRYYSFILLFIGSMEGLVLAGNLGAVYVFWEAVGLCSFALIAHYYHSPRASMAGVKALVTTRLADVAFLAGVAYAYMKLGSLDYSVLASAPSSVVAVVATLVFIGAVGKSAQLPLHVWLPDAMEGPTPVSALIHAATMVKAGVYIIARMATLTTVAGLLPHLVAVVGCATAVYAAVCAMAQYDAKRLLAYSTISQLGYIFAVLGASLAGAAAVDAALGHVVSHAVFKALLFLVVGVVIHELEPLLGPEVARDLRHVAGSLRRAPIVAAGLVMGALSLAGLPPFAGAWSKEELIAALYRYDPVLSLLLLAASVATAFYAMKLVYMLVVAQPPEESVVIRHVPLAMQAPIAVLAALTIASPWALELPHPHFEAAWAFAGVSAALAGMAAAWYALSRHIPAPTALYRAALEGFYLDEAYRRVLVPVLRAIFTLLARGITSVIDAGVDAAWLAARSTSVSLAEAHRDRVSDYITAFILGLLIVIVAALAVG